ncbi:MAG: mechanosensitive ion channel family protein [Candidatus Absconditabacterales bacterium]|nr:mechanosensitive ion channel family protein [Candidatus Absconditabacterales bacterium]
MSFLPAWLVTLCFSLAVIWVVAFFLIALFHFLLQKKLDPTYESIDAAPQSYKVVALYQLIVRVLILFFAWVLTFDAMGIDISVLVVGLSFGFTFALQNTMQTIIAALLLSTNKQIRLGECVMINRKKPITGVIIGIGIRYSTIRCDDNTRLFIPNHILIKQMITRWMTNEIVKYECTRFCDHAYPSHEIINHVRLALARVEWNKRPDYTTVFVDSSCDGVVWYRAWVWGEPISDRDNPDIDEKKPEYQAEMFDIVYRVFQSQGRVIRRQYRVIDYVDRSSLQVTLSS